MFCAAVMPAAPVHAFAQPLLTAIARARPPDCSRCRFETTTGAATVRLVVNTAAALAAWSATSRARSGPSALMPQATAAARKPAAAVMPPPIASIIVAVSPAGRARRRTAGSA